MNSVLQSGTLLGFPVTGAQVTFLILTAKEEHSSEPAFEIAARMATRAALQKAGMRRLEPIMAVDFVVPTDHAYKIGQMIDMLRGRTIEITRGDKETNIRASVPMSNLFGLASNLRILTKGRGSHTIECSHYDAVPKSTSENDPSNFPPAVGMRA